MAEVIDINEYLCSWRASGALNLQFLPNTKIIQINTDENQAKTMPVLSSGRKSGQNHAYLAIRTKIRPKLCLSCHPDEFREF
jgi:hypothetical protein